MTGGAEILAILAGFSLLSFVVVLSLVLREKARERARLRMELPPNYYRPAPPPLPAQRGKTPPMSGERRN